MTALVSDPRVSAIATIDKSEDTIQSKIPSHTVALSNQDILREIFCYLASNSDDPANSENKATLFRAALTCKAMTEPALDYLWWSISSFMPLLKLLRNFQVVQDGNNTLAFCNSFSEEDWTRFDYHAKRVREFHHCTALTQKIDTSALFLLGQCRPAIFPNLRRVVWTAPLSPLITLLASSTLAYVDIKTNESGDNAIIMTFMSALSHRTKSLTDAIFRGVLSKSCLALVPNISSLVTIVVPDLGASITMTFLNGLGAMERLQNLHIDIKNPAIAPIMFPDRLGFPELRTLNISGPFDIVHKFITGIASEQMTSILVSSHSNANGTLARAIPSEPDTRNPPDILDLLGYIGNRWPYLSRIGVDLPNTTPKYPDATSLTLFQPLRGCRALTSISMNAFMRPPSSDQDIIDIGHLWPAVQTLKIPFSPLPKPIAPPGANIPRPQHTPTTLGLRLLAQLCPHLTTLQLSLDTSGLPEITGEPLTHGLQVLSVGDSSVEDAYLVATHLDCLFPLLRTVETTRPASPPGSPNDWRTVEKILRVCQAARSSDRKRTTRKV
ncbi:hypothetical protein BD779DRAFT_642864 [Infundibulicybe gibba]|nr:hypothetical protein BD779DRAFT_642864 [Infundibulicybe gibba]